MQVSYIIWIFAVASSLAAVQLVCSYMKTFVLLRTRRFDVR